MADKWVVCQEETIGLQGHLTLAEHPCQVSHSALMGAGRRPVRSMDGIDRSDLVIQAFDSGPEP